MAAINKWHRNDTAFALGFCSRCPSEEILLELLIDSDFELPVWAREAILSLITQLNSYYSQRSALSALITELVKVDLVPHGISTAENTPDVLHNSQLSTVCARLFREPAHSDLVALYRFGAAIGQGIGMNLWSGAEPSQDEYVAIREAMKDLPQHLNAAFGDLRRLLKEFESLSVNDITLLLNEVDSLDFESSASLTESIGSLEFQDPKSLFKRFRRLDFTKPATLTKTLKSLGVTVPKAKLSSLNQLQADQREMLEKYLESLQPSLLWQRLNVEEYKYLAILRRVIGEDHANHFSLLDHLAEKLRRLEPDIVELKGGSRKTLRNLYFLKWSEGLPESRGLGAAEIRDRWNRDKPEKEQVGEGERGRQVVLKGIASARKFLDGSGVDVLTAIRSKENENP